MFRKSSMERDRVQKPSVCLWWSKDRLANCENIKIRSIFLSPGPGLLIAEVTFAESCAQPKRSWRFATDVLRPLCTLQLVSWGNACISSWAMHLIQASWDGNSPRRRNTQVNIGKSEVKGDPEPSFCFKCLISIALDVHRRPEQTSRWQRA